MKSILQLAIALMAGALIGLAWSSFSAHRLADQPSSISVPELRAMETEPPTADQKTVSSVAVTEQRTQEVTPVQRPIDSVEKRDDAMLYEIDALQGTPFGPEITSPGFSE